MIRLCVGLVLLVALELVPTSTYAAYPGPVLFNTGACLQGGPVPPNPKTILGANATNIQSGATYTVDVSDQCKLNKFTNAGGVAVSLPVFANKWMAYFEARGVGGITITPVSGTIDGVASWSVPQNTGVIIFSDGTNYHVFGNNAAVAAVALTNTHIFVGNASNIAADVAMSGDCTIANTGAITCTKIGGTTVTFPLALSLGGTHADLSATGGTGQVLKQSSSGANITVGAVACGDVTNGACLNVSQSWTAAQAVTPPTLTDASTITPDCTAGNDFILLTTSGVGASRTIANCSPSAKAGQTLNFFIQQAASGGPYAITWGSNFKWASGIAPTLSTAANAKDLISCRTESTSIYACALAIKGYS